MKTMLQASSLVGSLKRELQARDITYADLARRIGMSGASVKRMFSQKNFTLQRLDEILQAAPQMSGARLFLVKAGFSA